jgi:starch synthase (maltosyl-transferring)
MDTDSGLIFSPSHFTWMDTNFPAGTPRQGYPVEIQALWYAALKFASRYSDHHRWEEIAERVGDSIIKYFYREDLGYLSDCLHAEAGQCAADAKPDDALRPNQLFAVTLDAVTEVTVKQKILSACEELLVPGAIRSLAKRPVQYPLPIYCDERLMNDPNNPYWGRYEGPEDFSRKPAYHNGTAWTWVFPSFCEGWVKTYGKESRHSALAILGSSSRLINTGCISHVPEIVDGDFPHRQRGCMAQAWGLTELYRVWKLLSSDCVWPFPAKP